MSAITTCKRGHDLLAPGSLDETAPGKWRCRECRRITQREAARKKAATIVSTRGGRCSNGHLLTADTSRFVERSGGHRYRLCLICAKAPHHNRSGAQQGKALHADHDNTRLILDLCLQRENEPRAWIRAEITEQIQFLTSSRMGSSCAAAGRPLGGTPGGRTFASRSAP